MLQREQRWPVREAPRLFFGAQPTVTQGTSEIAARRWGGVFVDAGKALQLKAAEYHKLRQHILNLLRKTEAPQAAGTVVASAVGPQRSPELCGSRQSGSPCSSFCVHTRPPPEAPISLAGCLFLFLIVPGDPRLFLLLLVNSIAIGCALYALRGIYFALLEEGDSSVGIDGDGHRPYLWWHTRLMRSCLR